MFSTQYTLAQRFANIGSGNNDRTIYADIAARFADLSEQVGYLSVKARGAKGDGANITNRHDDSNAILDAVTQASLSGRGIEFPAGVYYITKNITIFDCKFYKGAILLPADNTVTIKILGSIEAGFYQIFDFSLSGKFLFWDNIAAHFFNNKIPHFKSTWFGVVGDNFVDDGINLNNLTSNIPSSFSEVNFPNSALHNIVTTWKFDGLTCVKFKAGGSWPSDSLNGPFYPCSQFNWSGIAGGIMIQHINSGQVVFENFGFNHGTAAVGVDITQVNGGVRISTQNIFKNVSFAGGDGVYSIGGSSGTILGNCCVRIGCNAPGNCESNYFEFAKFYGGTNVGSRTLLMGGRRSTCGGYMVRGSNRIFNLNFNPITTSPPGNNQNIQVGMPVIVGLAGGTNNGPGGQNSALNSTVTALGSNFIDLNDNAVNYVLFPWAAAINFTTGDIVTDGGNYYNCIGGHLSAAGNEPGVGASWHSFWVLLSPTAGGALSSGIYAQFGTHPCTGALILNQNSHRQRFYHCMFTAFGVGVSAVGGSMTLFSTIWSDNTLNIFNTFNSMPIEEYDANGENSLQHCVVGGTRFTLIGGRLANGYCSPGKGFFQNATGQKLVIKGFQFDNWQPYGTSLFDFSNCSSSNELDIDAVGDGQRVNSVELGFVNMGNTCQVEFTGIPPNDNSMAGKTKKTYTDKFDGDATGEQLGGGRLYQPAIVGNNPPTDAYIDRARFTFYRTRQRGQIKARLRNEFDEMMDFEVGTQWKGVDINANIAQVMDTDFGKVFLIDASGGPITVGCPYVFDDFQVGFIKIDSSANPITIAWFGSATYNGATSLSTIIPGTGWFIRCRSNPAYIIMSKVAL